MSVRCSCSPTTTDVGVLASAALNRSMGTTDTPGSRTRTSDSAHDRLVSARRRRFVPGVATLGVTALAALGSLASGAATPASASVPAPVVAVANSSIQIADGGAKVVMVTSVYGASTCTLSSTPALPGWARSFPCRNAVVRRTAVFPRNASFDDKRYVLWIAVDGPGGSLRRGETVLQAGAPLPQTSNSANWAGYDVPSASVVSAVSGEWTIPTLDCSATPNSGAAIWVGTGGGDATPAGGVLLQTGVITNCVDGVQQDSGWWDEVPGTPSSGSQAFSNFSVSPGDLIRASVYQSGVGAWVTRVDDLTTGLSGWMFVGGSEGGNWGVSPDNNPTAISVQGNMPGLTYLGGKTAEWIVEDYELTTTTSSGVTSSPLVTLADYGTVHFADVTGTTTTGRINLTNETILQGASGATLSVPSLPSGDGFSVSYTG